MRKFISLVVAAGILAAAYYATFGMPPWLAARITPDGAQVADGNAPPARGGGGPGRPFGRSSATSVVTTPLELTPYESVLSAIGTASALRSVDVITESAGTVIEANLAANRAVEEGDILVRFDARTEALNLEIAQAELERARDTAERYERLRESGNSTVTDVTLSEAQVDLRLAEAAVGLAEVALEDRTIRAPIAGRLGLSDVDVGDALSANSVIVSIDQSDVLVVEFELPERAVGMLARADEVHASTSTMIGRVFTGKIVSFDSRIDPVTRSVTVKAEIDNSEGLLWPGMTFSVRLMQESEPMPSVPSTAITWSRDGAGIWLAQDGVAHRVPVTIRFRRDETVWLDADIPEGTLVVTEGAQKLREGAKISTGAGPRDGAAPQVPGRAASELEPARPAGASAGKEPT